MNRRAAPYRPRALAPIVRVPGLRYDVLDELLGYSLRRAQVAMFAAFHDATRGMGVTPPRFTALVVIGANPGLSQTVLGNVLGIARSGAMLLASRFEAQGWVERRHRPDDGRAWGLYLTPKGERLLETLRRRVRVQDQRFAARLSKPDQRRLLRMLERLTA